MSIIVKKVERWARAFIYAFNIVDNDIF